MILFEYLYSNGTVQLNNKMRWYNNILVILGTLRCHGSSVACFSAVLEFLCDLMYNITMSRIHTSVQGLVFNAVLKQDITFFDNNKPGKSCVFCT